MTYAVVEPQEFYNEAVASGTFFNRFFPKGVVLPEGKLIGLTGKARSGKDTVGGMLKKAYGARTLSFAEPIRQALRGMMPFLTEEHFHGSLKEVEIEFLGKSPRQMMQTLGTEWGRMNVNNDIWLKLASKQLDDWKDEGYHAVVTDVRFENEAHLIRERGGVVWHIHNPRVQAVASHASEGGIKFKWGDVQIDNSGNLNNLFEEVCDAF